MKVQCSTQLENIMKENNPFTIVTKNIQENFKDVRRTYLKKTINLFRDAYEDLINIPGYDLLYQKLKHHFKSFIKTMWYSTGIGKQNKTKQ